jgi:hypothetical protein
MLGALATAAFVGAVEAQEVPEFGSVVGNTVSPGLPPDREDEVPPAIVLTGARILDERKWSLVAGLSDSSDRSIYNVEARGDLNRGMGVSDQLSLAYSRIDLDDAGNSQDQLRLRGRRKFVTDAAGWTIEGQIQVTRRWNRFTEPAAQINLSRKFKDGFSLTLNAGYLYRDREGDPTLKDTDVKVALKQILTSNVTIGTDYRFANDVIGEDDYTFGIELFSRLSAQAGKGGVVSASYVYKLSR